MPARPTQRERFNYAFDKTLSHGPTALIGWLGLATLILIVIAIAVIMVGRGAPQGASFVDVLWNVVYQALTPNPVDPTAFPPLFMIVTFAVTIGSLFLVSILIGILSNEVQGRVYGPGVDDARIEKYVPRNSHSVTDLIIQLEQFAVATLRGTTFALVLHLDDNSAKRVSRGRLKSKKRMRARGRNHHEKPIWLEFCLEVSVPSGKFRDVARIEVE